MAPYCCRCNGKGKCRSCVCVRNGAHCVNCLPSKRGFCENMIQSDEAPTSSSFVPNTNRPTPPSDRPSLVPNNTRSTLSPISNAMGIPSVPTPSRLREVTGSTFTSNSSPPRHLATPVPPLPTYTMMSAPNFTWGRLNAQTFIGQIQDAYDKVIHWRRNVFLVPSGSAGCCFVDELANLFREYGEASALESIVLKTSTVYCVLLLQKHSRTSKAHDHSQCLERRLQACRNGDIHDLLQEGSFIQSRLPVNPPHTSAEQFPRQF